MSRPPQKCYAVWYDLDPKIHRICRPCYDVTTSALDPKLRDEVLRVMRQLAEEGMTMIVVTHEMQFARDMADRILFFDGGVVAESGPPEQIFGKPQRERTREFVRRVASA